MKRLLCFCLFTGTLFAQAPAPSAPPPVAAPPTPPPATVPTPAGQDQLARAQKTLQDWPALGRYRDDNTKLLSAGPVDGRVVFMGDSITDGWGRKYGQFFPGKPYVNRGISGQTTPQMLVRFQPDVIALKPKAVVILAGTNDIAGNTGPESLEDIESNMRSMVELAQRNDIKVVLSSVMPVCDYIKPQLDRRPMEKIIALNEWMKNYAKQEKLIYLDYFTPMLDDKQLFKKELTYDGLHPNEAGYAVMAPLAQRAVDEALGK